MRFSVGPFRSSPDFKPDAPWKPIREPGPILMQVFAAPIGVVTATILAVLWYWLTPVSGALFGVSVGPLLCTAMLVIPVHEFLHLLVHPGSGASDNSFVGFWPSRLLCYAQYDGEVGRSRVLLILLMPFLVLSCLPLLICAVLQDSPPVVALMSLWNGLLSCGDLFAVGLLLHQVPSGAMIRDRDWWTYWRVHSQSDISIGV